ncbi:hypothetical protein BH10BAC4_BH10BAC4_18570 [soil metagenome]
MSTRSDSGSSVLLALVLICTFPLWFGIGAGIVGIIIGLMGAVIGIVAGFFGVVIGLICLPFKILFGWGDWHHNFFPHFHNNGFIFLAILIIAALIISKRKAA